MNYLVSIIIIIVIFIFMGLTLTDKKTEYFFGRRRRRRRGWNPFRSRRRGGSSLFRSSRRDRRREKKKNQNEAEVQDTVYTIPETVSYDKIDCDKKCSKKMGQAERKCLKKCKKKNKERKKAALEEAGIYWNKDDVGNQFEEAPLDDYSIETDSSKEKKKKFFELRSKQWLQYDKRIRNNFEIRKQQIDRINNIFNRKNADLKLKQDDINNKLNAYNQNLSVERNNLEFESISDYDNFYQDEFRIDNRRLGEFTNQEDKDAYLLHNSFSINNNYNKKFNIPIGKREFNIPIGKRESEEIYDFDWENNYLNPKSSKFYLNVR